MLDPRFPSCAGVQDLSELAAGFVKQSRTQSERWSAAKQVAGTH